MRRHTFAAEIVASSGNLQALTNHAATGESEIFEVHINDAAGASLETIRTTNLHPFWVDDLHGSEEGKFIAAQDLRSGDKLRLATNSSAFVSNVQATGIIEAVFNFTVEGWHTYYVGHVGVWVHNTNCIPKLNKFEARQLRAINRQARMGGNQGIRRPVTPDSFDAIARNFVGEGFTRSNAGKFDILRSSDGFREVRTPVLKPPQLTQSGQRRYETDFLGNFETRNRAGDIISNVHLSVLPNAKGRSR